ncbi:hypothetical protein Goari_010476 [Gossypium aridum]|uniref:RNase H type-1 domain-containing protein n=1 Tax=Gossypium aridum TaxID=34290 RepID=A0A7J8Y068_GOSAI|nr:hypothetical protein [Gossypium aridum]
MQVEYRWIKALDYWSSLSWGFVSGSSRGINQLLVESGCLIAANMLNGQIEETKGSLARIVRELLARDWHVKAMFTPRTANMAADSMAALGRNVPLGLRIYDVPPR